MGDKIKRGAFKNVSDEELIHYYIELNLSAEELAEMYHTTESATRSYLSHRGIKKGKELAQACQERVNLEKLGVKTTLQLPEVQEKVRATIQEKYGTDNVLKLKEIQEKAKATTRERYGVDNVMSLKETHEKARETLRRKLGVDHPSQSEEIKEKMRKTSQAKYGANNPMQNEEVARKCVESYNKTREQKTGTANFSELSEGDLYDLYITQNLSAKQIAEKYGREPGTVLALMSERGIKKSRVLTEKHRAETSIENWGTPYPIAAEEVRQKGRQTKIERYGTDNTSSLPWVQEKFRQTCREKYGVDNPNKLLEIVLKRVHTRCGDGYPTEIMNIREKMIEYLDSLPFPLSIPEIAEGLKVSYSSFLHNLLKFNLKEHPNVIYNPLFSKEEKEVVDFIKELGITVEENTWGVIPDYELDVYIPDKKIAIEYNGDFWHCELRKPIKYHQKKSQLCEERGIFLYHIFEYEWNDKDKKRKILAHLKSLLGVNSRTIYARACEIKEVSSQDKKEFLEENHLQGDDSSTIRYGLYCQDELVSLMTFGRPRFTKKYQWEILRFCSKEGVSVVGGASKLFKHFLENSEGSIVSYSNFAKMSGNLYPMLGFVYVGLSKPSYVWFKGRQVLTRFQTQVKNEIETMHNEGYNRIFDCGNKVWAFIR